MTSNKNPGGPVSILMPTKDQRLLKLLFDISFLASPILEFPLSSGISSRHYIDCKKALSVPEVRVLVGELIFDRIHHLDVDGVGGLELGAYPIGIAVSDAAYKKGVLLNAFVIRKEPKVHGLKKHIEGRVKKGDRVVIVDDVITTGNSTVQAIRKSREAGLEVMKAIALIDRQELNGRENIEQQGVAFEALFTLEDLIALQPER